MAKNIKKTTVKIKKTAVEGNKDKKYLKWIWRLFFAGLGFAFLLFFLTSIGVFGKLPTFDKLENPQSDLASQVISEDGKTIGKYFEENRTPVKYKDLSQNLVDAVIATEDARFHNHSGIDFRATTRAFVYLGTKGGASTITQQLSKLLFHGYKSSGLLGRLSQKLKEWIIAIRLEKRYTKEEIIAMYLNKQGFLFNAVGIRSASRIYFGKEPHELKQEESAVFAAMLKNPRQYNPHRKISKKKSHLRRNQVLKNLNKYGYITLQAKDSLQKLPMVLDFSPEDTNDGMATYFREYLRKYMKTWVKNNPKEDGTEYSIYRDGLKIYVSIDSRMQQHAEEAMEEHMSNLQEHFDKYQKSRPKWQKKFIPFEAHAKSMKEKKGLTLADIDVLMLREMKNSDRWRQQKKVGVSVKKIKASFHEKTAMKVFSWKGDKDTIMTPYDSIKYYKAFLKTGIMSVEPQTGHVKAWVGGINHKHFKYDAVKQQSRQVGSTFKPFVYATAINQLNYSPCKKIDNRPFIMAKGRYGIPEEWSVSNAGSKDIYGEPVTIKEALARSLNVVSARIIDEVSPSNVVKLARKMGVKNKNLIANPSIALGAVDLSLYEMISALSTFANKGVHFDPIMILRIEDKNGTELESFTNNSTDVMNEETAYAILNLMEGVTQKGSGVRLRTKMKRSTQITGYPYGFENSIAGKTGTTQNQSDGWFMGMVPNLATGVWVGADNRSVHFPDIGRGQGAAMALPIWGIYYKKLYADESLSISKEAFKKPANLSINLDCDTEDDPIDESDEFDDNGKPKTDSTSTSTTGSSNTTPAKQLDNDDNDDDDDGDDDFD